MYGITRGSFRLTKCQDAAQSTSGCNRLHFCLNLTIYTMLSLLFNLDDFKHPIKRHNCTINSTIKTMLNTISCIEQDSVIIFGCVVI